LIVFVHAATKPSATKGSCSAAPAQRCRSDERRVAGGFHGVHILVREATLLVVPRHASLEIIGVGGSHRHETLLTLCALYVHLLDLFAYL
jgi:hypothetical protein